MAAGWHNRHRISNLPCLLSCLLTVVMERKKSDKSYVDVIIRVLACATVILLACIAAAISCRRMRELAIRHGDVVPNE